MHRVRRNVNSHLVALPEMRLGRPAARTPRNRGRGHGVSGRGDAIPARFTDERMGAIAVLVSPETCNRLGCHGDTVAFAVVWLIYEGQKENFCLYRRFFFFMLMTKDNSE